MSAPRPKGAVIHRARRMRGSAAALALEARAREAQRAVRRAEGGRSRGSGGSGEAAGGRWPEVNAANPCRVCRGVRRCAVSPDGTAKCTRVLNGPDAFGHGRDLVGEFALYPAPGAERRTPRHPREDLPAPPVVAPDLIERADAATRDRAYRALLDALTLNEHDRAELARRGLPPAEIVDGLYRTLPDRDGFRLARAVLAAVGDLGARIPGMVPYEGDRGRAWMFRGPRGGALLLPVLDIESRVVALKVRRRDPCEGPRYLSITSRVPARDDRPAYNGPCAEAALHIPPRARERLQNAPGAPGAASAVLCITEGELKAAVVCALTPWAAVSIPGVSSLRLAVDLATLLRPGRVVVALDADARENPAVARARIELRAALAAHGIASAVARWPANAGKGLDDVLAARSRGEVNL